MLEDATQYNTQTTTSPSWFLIVTLVEIAELNNKEPFTNRKRREFRRRIHSNMDGSSDNGEENNDDEDEDGNKQE